jgi:flagellar hook-length control protein FliK
MNMMFADMTNTLPNLIHQDTLGTGNEFTGFSRGEGLGFEAKLAQVVKKLETSNGESMGQAEKFGKAEKKNGTKFLSDLEKSLLKISNGDLNNITMDLQGLDALKALLVKAGFDPDQVSDIIGQLKEKAGEKDLQMDEVMDSLSELLADGLESIEPEEVVLETSALPFIIGLLDDLGVPKDLASSIVNKADLGQEGISLNILVQELKQLDAQHTKAGTGLGMNKGSESFTKVMELLNMTGADNTGNEKISLKDLISAFDAHIKAQSADGSKSQNPASTNVDMSAKQSVGELAGKWFESFTIAGDTTNVNVFSYQQVKNQFENELMIPGKGKNMKTGLFSDAPPVSEKGAAAFLKEIEAVFSKHTGKDAAEQNQNRFTNIPDREPKTKGMKIGDFFQDTAPQGKNDISDHSLNGVKTKTTERALPSYVTHQVNKGIIRAINQGETSLKLQLKPAELGRLTLTIDNVGNSIKVSIITENQAAKDMLASNVNELKSALSTAGISLDSFDVDMSSDFKQSMANAGNQAGNFSRKNSGKGKEEFNGVDLETGGEPGNESDGTLLEGSYHFVA